MNQSTRRATVRFLTGNGIAAAGAVWLFFRYMHSTRPDGPFWAKIWLVLACVSILMGLLRVLYYRNRRDYFAEEMDHRREIAKDSHSFELKAKS